MFRAFRTFRTFNVFGLRTSRGGGTLRRGDALGCDVPSGRSDALGCDATPGRGGTLGCDATPGRGGTLGRNAHIILLLVLLLAVALACSLVPTRADAVQENGEAINDIIARNVDWSALKRASANSQSSSISAHLEENLTDLYGSSLGSRTTVGNDCILIPARSYDIDPTITIEAKSAPCVVFAVMSDELLAIEDPRTSAEQLEANGWNCISEDLGVWKYRDIVDAEDDDVVIPLLSSITVRGDWEPEPDISLENTFTAVAVGETTRTAVPEEDDPDSEPAPQTSDRIAAIVILLGATALGATSAAIAIHRRSAKEDTL